MVVQVCSKWQGVGWSMQILNNEHTYIVACVASYITFDSKSTLNLSLNISKEPIVSVFFKCESTFFLFEYAFDENDGKQF